MHSAKVFSLLILALFSLAQASQGGKKKIKRIPKYEEEKGEEEKKLQLKPQLHPHSQQPAEFEDDDEIIFPGAAQNPTLSPVAGKTRTSLAKEKDEELKAVEKRVLPLKVKDFTREDFEYIGVARESIPQASSSGYVCTVDWESFSDQKRRFRSTNYMENYMSLLQAAKPDANYFDLIIEESELEDQVNPTRSIVARVMAKYRRDRGLPPMANIQNYAPEEVILRFISLYIDCPVLAENSSEQLRVFNMFRSLQDYGVIPEDLSGIESAGQFFAATQLDSFKKMNSIYKKLSEKYTIIDWNLLDLTPFKYQFFPYEDSRLMKKYPYQQKLMKPNGKYGSKTLHGDMEFSVNGISLMEEHFDHIRFHNPETLLGSRLILFQRLYRRYFIECKSKASNGEKGCDSYRINWGHCHVPKNWPSTVSTTDSSSWTPEQIWQMNKLIDENKIKFEFVKRKEASDTLSPPISINPDELIEVRNDFIDDGKIAISFSRKVNGAPYTEEAARIYADLDSKRDAEKRRREAEEEEAERRAIKESKTRGRAKAAAAAAPAKEKVVDAVKSPKNKGQNAQHTPTDVINVKVDSPNLASPDAKLKAYEKALAVFQKKSGHADAQQIDWSLLNRNNLQNRLAPFSFSLRTVGDVKTLLNLIKKKALNFYDLSTTAGRAAQLEDRIYDELYSKACGQFRHEYEVYWEDMTIGGWPDGINTDMSAMSLEDFDLINAMISRGEISAVASESLLAGLAKYVEDASLRVIVPISVPKDNGEQYVPRAWACFSGPPSVDDEDDASFESLAISRSATGSRLMAKIDVDPFSPAESSMTPGSTASRHKTPSFTSIMRGRSPKRKLPGSKSYDEDEDLDFDEYLAGRLLNGPAKKAKEETVLVGSFAGANVELMNEVLAALNESIAAFTAAKSTATPQTRLYRTFDEIVRCYTLLLEHHTSKANSRCRLIPVLDIQRYLQVFMNTLWRISLNPGNELSPEDALTFNATRFELRARLAGAAYNAETGELTVRSCNFKNNPQGMFNSFIGIHSQPNSDLLQLAEFFLDEGEELVLFKELKSSKTSK